ncbi:F-box/FBD/LRR-repeat protein At1g13570-like [Nicotiana sylvestris]|uniref:F-box/FBD/LRR-repeat protein At1g13570-like n=1 Tax=Nicotiana sylvestris TaxID=4096 RepID=A0A1U7WM76_NICSY|nr:PREDICTED: F-box/FBD/LRR-repeat protein At1g13570-like [Nicotiana sylvestris]
MTDSCNRLAVGRDKIDRLSDLPINVMHQIQDHMSIEDAAKMSILSSTWRYAWASNPKLVFDTPFCTKRMASNTIDIISTILLQHHGAIKIFLVDISVIHSSQHSVIDQWMLFLSTNGLVDLTLRNQNNVNAPYELPSYLYSVGLERLVLSNCIFRPACSFRGFHKLKTLLLKRVAFELVAATSSLWMPNLERLRFTQCSGFGFLNIYAPNLFCLCFYGCGNDTLKLSPFMECTKLKIVAIESHDEVSLNRQDKTMKLTNLLSSWPNLSHLILGRYFLKFFASGTGAESLPTRLTRLRCLYLSDCDFDREDQISPLLSILRSSPNLEILQILSGQRNKCDMEMDVNLIEEQDNRAQGRLNNLQMLLIKNFHGSRIEVRFVRFILGSTPLLRKAILLVDTNVNERQYLKISEELMQFPRASPRSKIVFRPCSKEQGRSSMPCC